MRYSPADRSMVIRPFATNGRSREAETRASVTARTAGPVTNAITTAAVTIVRICDDYENRIRPVPPDPPVVEAWPVGTPSRRLPGHLVHASVGPEGRFGLVQYDEAHRLGAAARTVVLLEDRVETHGRQNRQRTRVELLVIPRLYHGERLQNSELGIWNLECTNQFRIPNSE